MEPLNLAPNPLRLNRARIKSRWLDRLRRLLNHPGVLAADSSEGRVLAFPPTIAVSDSPASLDWNVGPRGRNHGPLARHLAL
jgi:hypothetical protein